MQKHKLNMQHESDGKNEETEKVACQTQDNGNGSRFKFVLKLTRCSIVSGSYYGFREEDDKLTGTSFLHIFLFSYQRLSKGLLQSKEMEFTSYSIDQFSVMLDSGGFEFTFSRGLCHSFWFLTFTSSQEHWHLCPPSLCNLLNPNLVVKTSA